MDETDLTIAGIAAGDPTFSTLVTALGTAGLVAALDNPEDDLTVFAPTNAAFAALAADLGYAGDPEDGDAVFAFLAGALAGLDPEGDPVPALTDILLYHVSPGAQTAAEIAASPGIATLLEGTGILPAAGRLIDFEPDLLDPEIVVADIAAANGTVQVIDRVLLPLDIPGNDRPSIAEIASGNADFEVLTLALEAAGLTEAFADPNGEFTVFAPTDDAFAALAQGFGFTGDATDADAVFAAVAGALAGLAPDGDPIPLLTEILSYHVVSGASDVATLTAAAQVDTLLADGRVILTEAGTVIDADPAGADPALLEGLTDIAASNGLVNAIDGVLLPLALTESDLGDTIADLVAASGEGFDDDAGDFDILLGALSAAGLVEALDNPGDAFTVFAPTDGAFQDLATALGADGSTEQAAFDGIVAALSSLASDGDPIPLLTSVLLYHVAEGAFGRAALAGSPELTTLFGPAPATDGATLADADRGFADPAFIDAASDIVTANGIVHAIDAVLLPLNVPDATDTIGSNGDDALTLAPETLAVDGGTGTDSLRFAGTALEEVDFGFIEGGFSATTDGRTVEIVNVESFLFADETVVVDTGELPAAVFRLYGVGLGREADIPGISFWVEEAEARGLGAIADAVLVSEEFADLFGGEVPGDEEIVEALYGNFLDREADEAGLAFWNAQVESGALDTSDLLLAFSESLEFRALTEPLTDDGVLLLA